MFKFKLFATHLNREFVFYSAKIEDWDEGNVSRFLKWLDSIGVDLSLPDIHYLIKNGTCLEDSYSLTVDGGVVDFSGEGCVCACF